MKKFFTKLKNGFKKILPTKRRIVQLYTALLFNANIKGWFNGQIYQGPTKKLCVPGLNCYSCPGATGACPMGSLQNALIDSKTRMPTYIVGIIILFGLILGRTICGWLCPIGLGQELLYKIKTPKVKKSKATRVFSYFKYVILIFLVVILPLSMAVPGFCEFICPAGTFQGGLGLLPNKVREDLLGQLGPIFTWKFIVLVAVIVMSIFMFRFFCRFLCPLGALYGLFCKIAMLGLKVDKNKCTDCGLCIKVCKMDTKKVGDHECIQCGECIAVCPTKAIAWKGSKMVVRGNDTDVDPSNGLKPLTAMLQKESVDEKPSEMIENVENVPSETGVENE
jgi:ferredoxin